MKQNENLNLPMYYFERKTLFGDFLNELIIVNKPPELGNMPLKLIFDFPVCCALNSQRFLSH